MPRYQDHDEDEFESFERIRPRGYYDEDEISPKKNRKSKSGYARNSKSPKVLINRALEAVQKDEDEEG